MNSLAPTAPLAVAGEFLKQAPVDLAGMADALGLTVDMEAQLPPDVSGRIVAASDSPSGYHIDINAGHSTERKRYTLAYEIAHFMLHKSIIGEEIEHSKNYVSRLDPEFEVGARRVAAQILTPYRLVRRIYDAGVSGARTLSGVFQVPEEFMRRRLEQFNLRAA